MKCIGSIILIVFMSGTLSLLAQQEETTPATSAAPVQAQPEKGYFLKSSNWALGGQFGTLSGLGIGVRFHPMGRFSFQFAGGALKTGDNWGYNIGVEGQFDFDTFGLSRFYGLAGIGIYDHDAQKEANLLNGTRFGVGAGYDWQMSRNLVLSFAVAFNYYPHKQFFPYPEAGFFYYFN